MTTHDEINVGTAMRLLGAGDEPPFATCPRDGEPLISCMERAGAEFVCIACGDWFGFLSLTPAAPTPELQARYELLRSLFDAGERGPLKVCAACDGLIDDGDPHTDPDSGEDLHAGCCPECRE